MSSELLFNLSYYQYEVSCVSCGSEKNAFQKNLSWMLPWSSSASCQCQVVARSTSCPLPSQRAKSNPEQNLMKLPQISHHPTTVLCYSFVSLVGYFWPPFRNKVSPKETCLNPFHPWWRTYYCVYTAMGLGNHPHISIFTYPNIHIFQYHNIPIFQYSNISVFKYDLNLIWIFLNVHWIQLECVSNVTWM